MTELVDEYLASDRVPFYERSSIERARERVDNLRAELDAVAAKEAPLTQEYARRGGWTRAFLVAGIGGHVHSTMGCKTCNRMGQPTRFQWMTDYSASTEAEIVDAAGWRACTICYSSAPLDPNRPTRMFSTDEVAAEQARAAREGARAAKAAKAVYGIDGRPLTVRDGHWSRTVATERAASNLAIDMARSLNHYGEGHPSAGEWRENLTACVAALARKRGVADEDVLAEIQKKASKPIRY